MQSFSRAYVVEYEKKVWAMWFSDPRAKRHLNFSVAPCHEFESNFIFSAGKKSLSALSNMPSLHLCRLRTIHSVHNAKDVPASDLKVRACSTQTANFLLWREETLIWFLHLAVHKEKDLLCMPHWLPFTAEDCWCGAHNDWGLGPLNSQMASKLCVKASDSHTPAQTKVNGRQAASLPLCPWQDRPGCSAQRIMQSRLSGYSPRHVFTSIYLSLSIIGRAVQE